MNKILEKDIITISYNQNIVKIIPTLGGKIIEYSHYDSKKEKIYQPIFNKLDYYIDNIKDFSKSDTSGVDDCLPTIDSCYSNEYNCILQDHGEVWNKNMDIIEIGKDFVVLSLKLDNIGFSFQKKISINSSKLRIDYELSSENEDMPYLWAFHGLMKLDGCKEIIANNEPIQQVYGDKITWDYYDISSYPKDKAYKFYFKNTYVGKLALRYDEFFLHYTYPNELIKYLGVWITTGGFKGEKNIALEPCTGYYDSLNLAIKNQKCSTVGTIPVKWFIELEVRGIYER